MAVAYNQIEEVVEVVRQNVDDETLLRILTGLGKTKAFKSNGSFRASIERMAATVGEKLVETHNDAAKNSGSMYEWSKRETL